MSQVKPVPTGMHTVTPHLVCADALPKRLNFISKLLMRLK